MDRAEGDFPELVTQKSRKKKAKNGKEDKHKDSVLRYCDSITVF